MNVAAFKRAAGQSYNCEVISITGNNQHKERVGKHGILC